MADQTKAPTKGQDAGKAQERTRRPEQPVQEQAQGLGGEAVALAPILGDSAMDLPVERHAALLGDPRFSQPANAAQRARILSQIQRSYGNAHVQRVMERIEARTPEALPNSKSSNPVVQRLATGTILGIASLGAAAFSEGKSLATSGMLSCEANTPSYMHEKTPTSEEWEPRRVFELQIVAHHPRYGHSEQRFYFRVAYTRNGYDIRNATVNVLKSKSSSMIVSSFDIKWAGQAHSQPKDPVAKIIFNISNSTWNPYGLGICSFWGRLIISASKSAGDYEEWTIDCETTDFGKLVWRE